MFYCLQLMQSRLAVMAIHRLQSDFMGKGLLGDYAMQLDFLYEII